MLVVPSVFLLMLVVHQGPPSWVHGQGIFGHQHPHRIMANAPCPACLDGRLTQHYRARNCRPVILGNCECPSRFNCQSYFDENNDGNLRQTMPVHNYPPSVPQVNQTDVIRGRSLEDEDEDYFNHCDHDGNHYAIGQVVPTADPCRICVCSYMNDGSLNLDCETRIECPTPEQREVAPFHGYFTSAQMLFRPQSIRRRRRPQNSNGNPSMTLRCYDYYSHDQCCPRQECMPINARTGRTIRPRKTCQYAGQEYHLGEKIQLKSVFNLLHLNHDSENHIDSTHEPSTLAETLACMSCICTAKWNNQLINESLNSTLKGGGNRLADALEADTISCRRKHCYLELDQRFRSGCIPVYDEEKCCPVDFICPRTRQMSLRVRGVDYGSKLCHFEGRKYPVGAKIYQSKNSAADCVDCECRIPPEFTCLRRKDC